MGTSDYSRSIYSGKASANYHIGRLSTGLGYEYQKSENISDTNERHFISLDATRSF